ncbi:MAG: hypothetical protein IKX53_02050 [Bacteroidales bacterium]|nr:hypothetical protein [Bacteroidales bacterium]
MAPLRPIDSPESMIAAIRHFGVLPFFRCSIPGWSVEDLTAPGCWFSDDEDTFLGPWDWKIDAVREGDIAYGKFLGGKAAFATVPWYRELMNWRRSQPQYKMAEGGRFRTTTTHDRLLKRLAPVALAAIREAGALEARELRLICSAAEKAPVKKITMDSVIQYLQMGTWTVIGDFERVYLGPDLHYAGWQRASNTTPDELFAAPILPFTGKIPSGNAPASNLSPTNPLATPLSPAASRDRLIAHISRFFPATDPSVLERMI